MMEPRREQRRWIGWAALAIGVLAIACMATALGLVVFFSPAGNAAREGLMGETPEAKIAAYMRAVRRGDRATAVEAWEPGAPTQLHHAALEQRREQVTDELLALKISEFTILEYEWWTTCCEPHVICDARNAGGARVQVQLLDDQGNPQSYVFDVFTREQPYWGDAMGNPFRRWVIRDVYAAGEEPLYWRWVHESNVRYLK